MKGARQLLGPFLVCWACHVAASLPFPSPSSLSLYHPPPSRRHRHRPQHCIVLLLLLMSFPSPPHCHVVPPSSLTHLVTLCLVVRDPLCQVAYAVSTSLTPGSSLGSTLDVWPALMSGNLYYGIELIWLSLNSLLSLSLSLGHGIVVMAVAGQVVSAV